MCVRVRVRECVYVRLCVHVYVHVCAYVHVYVCVCVHVCVCAYMYTAIPPLSIYLIECIIELFIILNFTYIELIIYFVSNTMQWFALFGGL
jgi:hypothetical protein